MLHSLVADLTFIAALCVALLGCEQTSEPPEVPPDKATGSAPAPEKKDPPPVATQVEPDSRPAEAPSKAALKTEALKDAPIEQKANYVFERSPVSVGERYLMDSTETTRMKTKVVAGEESKEGDTETEAFTKLVITAMEIDDKGSASKARYRYLEVKERQKDKGRLSRFKAPVSGKTYILTQSPEGVKITYIGGASPSQDEIAQVQRDAHLMGTSQRFFDLLPKRPLAPGDKIEVDSDKLKDFIFHKGTVVLNIQKPSLTFLEAREVDGAEAGLFEVHLSAVLQEGPLTINATLKGEVALEIGRGRVLRTSWQGPVMMTGSTKDGDEELKIAGTGQTTQAQVTIFQTPELPRAEKKAPDAP